MKHYKMMFATAVLVLAAVQNSARADGKDHTWRCWALCGNSSGSTVTAAIDPNTNMAQIVRAVGTDGASAEAVFKGLEQKCSGAVVHEFLSGYANIQVAVPAVPENSCLRTN